MATLGLLRVRGVVIGVALAVMAPGCGARVGSAGPSRPAGAGPVSEAPVAGSLPEPQAPSTVPAGETAEPARITPRPVPTHLTFGERHNTGTVRIELSAVCMHPGDLLVATIRTAPKAGLGMVAAFSDGGAHGALGTGESDSSGRFDWRIPIAPTVPPGAAHVLVNSTGANWKGGGGSADAPFHVAAVGEAC